MKQKYTFLLLVISFFVDVNAITRQELFAKYLNTLQRIANGRLMPEQRIELEKPRTLHDYDRDFINKNKVEYEKRRNYRDYSRQALIQEWQKHNPQHLWRKDHELHHIIPLGYGGRNVWWNIFPLTQHDHRAVGTGIHSSNEFRQLFPNVR